jgi:hypothetical protein
MSQMAQAQRFDDVRSCPSPQGQSEAYCAARQSDRPRCVFDEMADYAYANPPYELLPAARARFKPSASDV